MEIEKYEYTTTNFKIKLTREILERFKKREFEFIYEELRKQPDFKNGFVPENYPLEELIFESNDGKSVLFCETPRDSELCMSDEMKLTEGQYLHLSEGTESGYYWQLSL